ncbi:ferrous iron transport protein A [Pleurocapsa sp. CCALA 161]|uniref:FeoA family protein n=1 Tax=Pleurocapsa sp. CCALA 161 TaxID=2107688 RepID=UPI000D07F1B5|nr:FeoA family protein [Pleurocapsa sp. CCALA 161]PSB12559.1 ferrous iron transport protein A [Pleurocapsa sp. CCALA 161]
MRSAINIPELSTGSIGTIVGYSRVYGGYVGKLISQGLLPGTPFVVLSLNLPQGAVQIMLQEKIITLSKPEVNALIVETPLEDEID